MNASLQIEQYFTTIEYDYPDFHMIMDCYICTADNIELNKNVHDELKWLNLQNLDSVDWLPADETIVNRLKIYLSSTILVSACLLGDNCKYNGGNNFNQHVCDLIKGKRIIKICPEILAGLPLPRKPVEISGGRIITSDNEDMTQLYRESALKALQNITNEPIDLALLKANREIFLYSVNSIYKKVNVKCLVYITFCTSFFLHHHISELRQIQIENSAVSFNFHL